MVNFRKWLACKLDPNITVTLVKIEKLETAVAEAIEVLQDCSNATTNYPLSCFASGSAVKLQRALGPKKP